VHVFLLMYIYIYVYMCAALYICILYVFLFMYVHIYVCVYIYVYIYMYVYVFLLMYAGRQHLAQTAALGQTAASIWRRRPASGADDSPHVNPGGVCSLCFTQFGFHVDLTFISLVFRFDFIPISNHFDTSIALRVISFRSHFDVRYQAAALAGLAK
jgi:hypothetical protein